MSRILIVWVEGLVLAPVAEAMSVIGFTDNAYLGGTAPLSVSERFGYIANFFGITTSVK